MRSSECRLHSKWCLNLFLGAMTMLFFMVLALNMTYMRNQQQTSMATTRSWLEAGTYSRAYDISDLTGLCESYKPLRYGPEVADLRAMWKARAPLIVQNYRKQIDDFSLDPLADARNHVPTIMERDPVVLETYFGDLWREMWELHGPAAFGYWLRYVEEPRIPKQQAVIDMRNGTVWDVAPDFPGLGLEVHTVGTWMGRQMAEGNIGVSGDEDTFMQDLEMVCALSELQAISLTETAYKSIWQDTVALEPFREEEDKLLYLSASIFGTFQKV